MRCNLPFLLQALKTATPDACLLWPYSCEGPKGNSYGRTYYRGVRDKTHHIAWIETYGEIPQGTHVLHKCDVPKCFNPYHLFAGTHQDNMDDMFRKGRGFVPLCTSRKLTEDQVRDIRSLSGKMTQRALAKKFGLLSKSTIGCILRGEQWTHLLP